jgi:hypothetical protein
MNKCYYWYNYSDSTAVVTNKTDHIEIKYDGGGDVTFNSVAYVPRIIRIYRPSLHKYDDQQTAGEIIIEHDNGPTSTTGLLVCIPLKEDANAIDTHIVSQIIKNTSVEKNKEKNLNLSSFSTNFNLNSIIPRAAYYTYRGPLPYDECKDANIYQYVVFHPANKGQLLISKQVVDVLDNLITFSFITARKGRNVFFNAKGTTSNGFNGDDQIYIQCQPAGESEEQEVYKEPISPFQNLGDANGAITYIIFIILGVAFIMFAFWVFQKAVGFLSHPPKKIAIITGGSNKLA